MSRVVILLLGVLLACKARPPEEGRYSALPPLGVAIGTAHPIAVMRRARNARWVVVCQARTARC
jgi:hypothetical protein